ncbi:hypothetical protein F2Q69_00020114 [Brassica cretica]|uniref:Uncharacterized protein n=1 Tax=Brassica cretica TaxID=69181 RepID=A0A8S9QB77_BRACR|nr:hypothetical protein F2Q69_00020114 [Brassica cretica]
MGSNPTPTFEVNRQNKDYIIAGSGECLMKKLSMLHLGFNEFEGEEIGQLPLVPNPKAFLILDELSLSSICSQLASRTATTRVPDQMRSVPARVPACSSLRPIVQLEVLLVVRFYNL